MSSLADDANAPKEGGAENAENKVEDQNKTEADAAAVDDKGLEESMALAKAMQEQEDAEMVNEAAKEDGDEGEQEPQGQPITSFVTKSIVDQLISMGYTQHAAEKALFLQCVGKKLPQSAEAAMEWLFEHAEDADLNDQLFMMGQSGDGQLKKQYQGNLSLAERKAAMEEKIRLKRI